jgi:uncharacterized protein YdcH (DUF465 family)
MDDRDKELCAKLARENEELKQICTKHQEYERQLSKMEKKGYLSSEDEIERKRLKKLKLAAKDKIETFLSKSR